MRWLTLMRCARREREFVLQKPPTHVNEVDQSGPVFCTVQPKNNARARTSFCVRKPATSCGFLRVACAWILQAARTSLRLEVKTARTSLQ